MCISCMFNEDATGMYFQILCMLSDAILLLTFSCIQIQALDILKKKIIKVFEYSSFLFSNHAPYYHIIPRTCFANALPY